MVSKFHVTFNNPKAVSALRWFAGWYNGCSGSRSISVHQLLFHLAVDFAEFHVYRFMESKGFFWDGVKWVEK